jgi:hypothetical protein
MTTDYETMLRQMVAPLAARDPRLRVTLEYDDIGHHVRELDGMVISSRTAGEVLGRRGRNLQSVIVAPDVFFKPSLRAGCDAGTSMAQVLVAARDRGWDTVGTTAFGEGRHEQLLAVLKDWDAARPVWVRIFHRDHGDFTTLKQSFTLVPGAHEGEGCC